MKTIIETSQVAELLDIAIIPATVPCPFATQMNQHKYLHYCIDQIDHSRLRLVGYNRTPNEVDSTLRIIDARFRSSKIHSVEFETRLNDKLVVQVQPKDISCKVVIDGLFTKFLQ